jgi:hypothetical protein
MLAGSWPAPSWRAAQVLCSTGNTREVFQWKHGKPRREWYRGLGVSHAKEGGSNDVYLSDHGRADIGCHGHLQSAGNASSPLYGRARQF